MIETKDGDYIPTSEVTSIAARGDKSAIRTRSGDSYVCNRPADELEKRFLPIIPASPGYYVLEALAPDSDNPEWSYVKTPIVAWRVHPEFAEAISIDDATRTDGQCPTVLAPDGSVTEPFNCSYENADAWLRSRERWCAIEKELDAKAAA